MNGGISELITDYVWVLALLALDVGGSCAGDGAPAIALSGFFPSEAQPYLFYACQNAHGCAGGGGGLTSRILSNQAWMAQHRNEVHVDVELPTAAAVTSEPPRCRTGNDSSSLCNAHRLSLTT